MRLFIAIGFSELKDYFLELQKQLPSNAKLSLVRSFHLTLKFLGEVQQNKVEEIISILKSVKFEPFEAYLDSVGIFPTENYIRVVWVGLKPEEKIIKLQSQIDESLKEMFRKEKGFEPHITLCRVKHPQDKKLFVEQVRKINVGNKKIAVRDFRLVKSTLKSQGPVYEDLEVFNS